MFFNTVLSEATKLRTTASFWWTTLLTLGGSVVGSAVIAGLTRLNGGQGAFFLSEMIPFAFATIGVPLLMIQSIMVVTTEYRYGLNGVNFLATPVRWQVMVAKTLMYALIAMLIAFVVLVLSAFISKFLLVDVIAQDFHPLSDDVLRRYFWVYPLVMALLVLFTQGIAMLVRQTAGAVAISLIWFLGIEQAVGFIPRVGKDIAPYLPFQNFQAFVSNAPVAGTDWNVSVSLGIFLAWSLGFWVAGLISIELRDA